MTLIWNPDLYDTRHSFVTALGADLLDVLAPREHERVLDVGCGTGDHVAALRGRGIDASGVDASSEMVARARQKFPGAPFDVADVRALPFSGQFDAVISNAVLHWVPDADAAAQSIAAVLKPSGRFVAELGGSGNVAAIVAGVSELLAERGRPPISSPWYFPSVGQYAAVLERAGLEVRHAWLFDRPTRLEGDDGLAAWVRMFGAHLLAGVADIDALLAELNRRLAPILWRDGHWFADYRRLRVLAVKP